MSLSGPRKPTSAASARSGAATVMDAVARRAATESFAALRAASTVGANVITFFIIFVPSSFFVCDSRWCLVSRITTKNRKLDHRRYFIWTTIPFFDGKEHGRYHHDMILPHRPLECGSYWLCLRGDDRGRLPGRNPRKIEAGCDDPKPPKRSSR